MNIETKYLSGHITEVKEMKVNGIPVGILEGYIATWDIDRGDDQFVKGAFADSLKDHLQRKRQIRMRDHHRETVGGFPIETVKEDDKGLFGIGNINLECEAGKSLYSLAKQGVVQDFSIGYQAQEFNIDNDIRVIEKAIIWEGSVVDEPMNINANITAVKALQDKFTVEQVKSWSVKELEQHLCFFMSNNAAKMLATKLVVKSKDVEIKTCDQEFENMLKSVRK